MILRLAQKLVAPKLTQFDLRLKFFSIYEFLRSVYFGVYFAFYVVEKTLLIAGEDVFLTLGVDFES